MAKFKYTGLHQSAVSVTVSSSAHKWHGAPCTITCTPQKLANCSASPAATASQLPV